ITVALNQLCQHRHAGKQAFTVPHDDTRLLAVGRNDHDGAALAGSEILLPVFETGEEHGDERKGEGLPAAAADDHPCLVMSLAVAVFASRALYEHFSLPLLKRPAHPPAKPHRTAMNARDSIQLSALSK